MAAVQPPSGTTSQKAILLQQATDAAERLTSDMEAKDCMEGLLQARIRAALARSSEAGIRQQLSKLNATTSVEADQLHVQQLLRDAGTVSKYVHGLQRLADSIAGRDPQ